MNGAYCGKCSQMWCTCTSAPLKAAEIQAVKEAIHGIDYQCPISPSVAVILRALLERQK